MFLLAKLKYNLIKLVSKESFVDVSNVVGGIHAYSAEVDPTIPTY